MKEHKTLNDYIQRFQNLTSSYSVKKIMPSEDDLVLMEYELLVKDLLLELVQSTENNPYQKMWEELKTTIDDEIVVLQNWCGACSVCINIPEPKEWSMADMQNKLHNLENKYLGE